jgi:hypothetical protein
MDPFTPPRCEIQIYATVTVDGDMLPLPPVELGKITGNGAEGCLQAITKVQQAIQLAFTPAEAVNNAE